MFKEKFNTLAVAIEDFALKEKTQPTFEKTVDQIIYFRTLVDEYYYILINLNNVKSALDETQSVLSQEIDEKIVELNTLFEPYKKEFIVKSYIKEIESFDEKNTFFEKLFKFEKMLVEKPIRKIEIEILQDILVYVNEFVKVSEQYYFFANNPYQIDDDLGVIIPTKYTYTKPDDLVSGVYNYIYGLYNTYKSVNEVELLQLTNLENGILEKIYQFGEDLRQAKKNKFYASFDTLSVEYYNKVNSIILPLKTQLDDIISSGVYRFYQITKKFNDYENDYNTFIDEYINHPLYKEYMENIEFDNKLDQLQEFVNLMEDGKINGDKEYILTDINLKALVEEIILITRKSKKTIYYTQKYHETGIPTKMVYEFYETEQFLNDIKRYYYELMTENIYRHSRLSLDDLGDGSVTEYRNIYKSTLSKYEQFLNQDNTFMNDFEVQEYIIKLENLQNSLKVAAMNFFDGAMKTSPLTFTDTIEKLYKSLLDKLVYDLEVVKTKNKIETIKLNVDQNREDALNKLRDISGHIEKLNEVMYLSRKYIFLDMFDFISNNIYLPYNSFYNEIKEAFNREEYIKVISMYDNFYKTSIFDFNMLFSLEKLADSTKKMFEKVELASNLYIDEQISEKPVTNKIEVTGFIEDMFDDETYKVVRNELFGQLDIYYEFVISVRPNEKPFLINEKNLKKVYFDNQLMKLNYIRLYHKVISVRNEYNVIKPEATKYKWFIDESKQLEKFDYKERLETLILNQNRILSEITKMITEYGSDNNFNTVDVTSEAIINVETYNKMFTTDIEFYVKTISKIKGLLQHEKLKAEYTIQYENHKIQWTEMINNNEIPEPEKVSYNEMDVFKGNIPFMVELEAKKETVNVGGDDEQAATFTWDFGNGVIKKGDKVSYTFFEEGNHTVRCDMTFASGEVSTRFIEFKVEGTTNSQIVKSNIVKYSPMQQISGTTIITYFDEKTQTQISMPINVTGDIATMIGDGSLTFEESDAELQLSKNGLVILGFDGVEFAGEPFDNATIFSEDFEMPEEAEFLFDFRVTSPIMNRSVINISDSIYIDYIAKVPKDTIESVYEIDDASRFQRINDDDVAIMTGDILIMKNKMNRYAVVKINGMREILTEENGKYYFEIDFEVYVNVSLNNYERTIFKPLETSLVVPTLVFKTNVRELFSSLVYRLEEIDRLKDELTKTKDTERILTINNQIDQYQNENAKYYLFEEYNKLKAKVISLESIQSKLWIDCIIDDTIECVDELALKNNTLEQQLQTTKTFKEYMNSIHVYDFRKNIVDLTLLVELYQDQLLGMEILIDTYNFKKYDSCDYFKTKVQQLKYFPASCLTEIENSKLPFNEELKLLVTYLRDYIFKLKLVINFPIMSAGKHILFSQIYTRPELNEQTGEYILQQDHDFYLLNKKLEMMYGWETEKVEMGAMYEDFIGEIVSKQKETFGNGLSDEDLENLGRYIQTVETRVVEEYDDFFMIPFWLDYLDKLNY